MNDYKHVCNKTQFTIFSVKYRVEFPFAYAVWTMPSFNKMGEPTFSAALHC